MPVTPFHMGPGLFLKGILQGSFSLMLFGWAQFLMDLQPLFAFITGIGKLHGFSHTYIGATLIGAAAALTGKHLSEFGLRLLDIREGGGIRIGWPIAVFSAYLGTYSHVVIDSIMHGDMAPYFPFSEANGLLGVLTVETLHRLCIYSGLIGAGLYFGIRALLGRPMHEILKLRR